VRIYYKPFVDWIWAGCFIMAFGGLLAITDRRYRLVTKKQQEEQAVNDRGAGEGVAAHRVAPSEK
jgi:cytochrome c-type biogenesis protein CcmF